MRFISRLLAITALLVPHIVAAQGVAVTAPGLIPGNNLSDLASPDTSRANLYSTLSSYDTRDPKWNLVADKVVLDAPVSTISGSTTVYLGCYVGNLSNAASSTLLNLWTGNVFEFSNINLASGGNALIGQPYEAIVPTQGTYTGTITSRFSYQGLNVTNMPSGGIASSINNAVFCWGPPTTTKLKVGQTITIPGAVTGRRNTDLITTIISIVDGYTITVANAPTITEQGAFVETVAATDNTTNFNLMVEAAKTNNVPALQINGDYFVPGVTGDLQNLLLYSAVPGVGSVWQNAPFTSDTTNVRYDVVVAHTFTPAPEQQPREAFGAGAIPALSWSAPITAIVIGDSLGSAYGPNPIAYAETSADAIWVAMNTQRRQRVGSAIAAKDRFINNAVNGSAMNDKCADVPLSLNNFPAGQSVMLTTNAATNNSNTLHFATTTVAGVTPVTNWAAGVQGSYHVAGFPQPVYVTSVTGTTVVLSGNVTVASGVQIQLNYPSVGDDVHGGIAHDLHPDVIGLEGDGNSGMASQPGDLRCLINKVSGWAHKPSLFGFDGYLWPEGNWGASAESPLDSELHVQSMWSGMFKLLGVPFVNIARVEGLWEKGFDMTYPALKERNDMPPSLLSENRHLFPWTATFPAGVHDWGADVELAPPASWLGVLNIMTAMSGDLQFRIGSDNLDAGNVFHIGYDSGTDCLRYKIDTSATDNAVPWTDTTFCSVSADTSDGLFFNVSFVGDHAFVQLLATKTAVIQQQVVLYDGVAPRQRDAFMPAITNATPQWTPSTVYTAGNVVANLGYIYFCDTGGTSAASGVGPNAPQDLTVNSLADGTARWHYFEPGYWTVDGVGPGFSDSSFATDQPLTDGGYMPSAIDALMAGPAPSLGYVNQYGYSAYLYPFGTGGAHHASTILNRDLRQYTQSIQYVTGPGAGGFLPVLASYTMQTGDTNIEFVCTSTCAITGPSNPQIGVSYQLKEMGGTVFPTITPAAGTGTIDGASSLAMTAHESVDIKWNGSNWSIH